MTSLRRRVLTQLCLRVVDPSATHALLGCARHVWHMPYLHYVVAARYQVTKSYRENGLVVGSVPAWPPTLRRCGRVIGDFDVGALGGVCGTLAAYAVSFFIIFPHVFLSKRFSILLCVACLSGLFGCWSMGNRLMVTANPPIGNHARIFD